MKKLIIFVIDAYQKMISPYLGSNCRFYPSCSEYAKEAFKEQPFFKAIFLSVKRVLRCHPFSEGGYDPIPVIKKNRM